MSHGRKRRHRILTAESGKFGVIGMGGWLRHSKPQGASLFDGPAELPRLQVDTSQSAIKADGTVHTVTTEAQLRGHLRNETGYECPYGDIIEIPAGTTITVTSKITVTAAQRGTNPDKKHILIRTGGYASICAAGTRINPFSGTDLENMATLLYGTSGGDPIIECTNNAKYLWFQGIEFKGPTAWVGGPLITISSYNGSTAYELALASDHIVFDRCYIHGSTGSGGGVGFGMHVDCDYFGVVDSVMDDCVGVDGEAKCITAEAFTGPMKLDNTMFRGSGENIMFGGYGAYASFQPADITITRNLFTRKLTWKSDIATQYPPGQSGLTYLGDIAGRRINAKNLLEFKTGQRVLIEGCYFQYGWADAQPAMLWLGPLDGAPDYPCEDWEKGQALVADITTRYCRFDQCSTPFGWKTYTKAFTNTNSTVTDLACTTHSAPYHVTTATGFVPPYTTQGTNYPLVYYIQIKTTGVGGHFVPGFYKVKVLPVNETSGSRAYDLIIDRDPTDGTNASGGTAHTGAEGKTQVGGRFCVHDNLVSNLHQTWTKSYVTSNPAVGYLSYTDVDAPSTPGYLTINHNTLGVGSSDGTTRTIYDQTESAADIINKFPGLVFTNNIANCGGTYEPNGLWAWKNWNYPCTASWDADMVGTGAGARDTRKNAWFRVGTDHGGETGLGTFWSSPDDWSSQFQYRTDDDLVLNGDYSVNGTTNPELIDAGTDGKDIGADIALVTSHTAGCISGSW